MLEALSPGWACSIIGFVSLAATPVPFLFYRYVLLLFSFPFSSLSDWTIADPQTR